MAPWAGADRARHRAAARDASGPMPASDGWRWRWGEEGARWGGAAWRSGGGWHEWNGDRACGQAEAWAAESWAGASQDQGLGGRRAHAVQIGLGTFGTVVQNLCGEPSEWDPVVSWLLEAVSESRPEHFRSVAVEPVQEHCDRLRKQAAAAAPHLHIVQCAVGDEDAEGTEVTMLTKAAHDRLVASVPPHQRKDLAYDLVYLRNMSCVGGPHPTFDRCRASAWKKYGVDLQLQPFRTNVWSYGRLAQELGFCGCELLLIDAEGHDAKILRSMAEHCREQEARGRTAWPDLIAFESAGLCDRKEGREAEAQVVSELEGHGYFVVLRCRMNTDMVRRQAMASKPRLRSWVEGVVCTSCGRTGRFPYTASDGNTHCRQCHREDAG